MAVISISYVEGPQMNDLGVTVNISYGDGLKNTKSFSTGNFVKDWYDCMKFAIIEMPGNEYLVFSSSVGHFMNDSGSELYESAYLRNHAYAELTYEYHEDRIRFFVPKGRDFTWLQLKEFCNDLN